MRLRSSGTMTLSITWCPAFCASSTSSAPDLSVSSVRVSETVMMAMRSPLNGIDSSKRGPPIRLPPHLLARRGCQLRALLRIELARRPFDAEPLIDARFGNDVKVNVEDGLMRHGPI